MPAPFFDRTILCRWVKFRMHADSIPSSRSPEYMNEILPDAPIATSESFADSPASSSSFVGDALRGDLSVIMNSHDSGVETKVSASNLRISASEPATDSAKISASERALSKYFISSYAPSPTFALNRSPEDSPSQNESSCGASFATCAGLLRLPTNLPFT